MRRAKLLSTRGLPTITVLRENGEPIGIKAFLADLRGKQWSAKK